MWIGVQTKEKKRINRSNVGTNSRCMSILGRPYIQRSPQLERLAYVTFIINSRLFQFAENVKCNRIFLGLIFWVPDSSLKKNSPSLNYLLHKTWNLDVLRRCRAVTAKKCTKKRDACAKLLFSFALWTYFFFWRFRCCRRGSSLLKLPNKIQVGMGNGCASWICRCPV